MTRTPDEDTRNDRDEDLEMQIEQNRCIAKQNAILKSFLSRCETASQESVIVDDMLSVEEKNDIVSEEIEYLQQQIKDEAIRGEEELQGLKDALQECENQILDIQHDAHNFDRQIVQSVDQTHLPLHQQRQKILKFFAERVQKKKLDDEKIKLRLSHQHLLVKKLQKLVREMESSEAVHVVDFEQMKIENRQLLDLIQEKNEELVQRKLSTSHAIQKLNTMKRALSEAEHEKQVLENRKIEIAKDREKCENHLMLMQERESKLQQQLQQALCRSRDPDKPDVISYVQLKSEVDVLQKQVAEWQRKMTIASLQKRQGPCPTSQ